MRHLTVLLSMAGVLGAGVASAVPQYAVPAYGPGYRNGNVVRCESTDNRTRQCPIDSYGRVQLLRQLSGAPCIEGRTWGATGGLVWVAGGCRGEFVAGTGYAQEYTGTGQTVRCESDDGRWRRCAIDTRGDVEFLRQLSDSACIEGRTWGRDQAGVWVDQGCRGEFRSMGRYGDRGVGQTIRCESDDGRYRQCNADIRGGARLLRQFSSSRCVEGRTWGVNRAGVWVDDGCRAEFETGFRGNNGWAWGQYPRTDRYGQGYGGGGQVVRCESSDGRTNRCNMAIPGGARMQRQLSETRCQQGYNWGWDRGGIWVSGGCRAEFTLW